MTRLERVNVDTVLHLAGFSHAVVAGDHVYVSGVLGTVDGSAELAVGGVRAETVQALRNIGEILGACGASVGDLVKTTVYLTDMDAFLEMDDAYRSFLVDVPARTTVYGVDLPLGAAVEIDAIAVRASASNG